MAKTRSPGYPAIGLKEAIAKAKLVYDKDYQNRVPKAVMASHMGYKSLSGASLPVIAALNQFGLTEGRGDETRVSDVALHLIFGIPGSSERLQAVRDAALGPDLFSELHRRFPEGKASDAAIRSYLLTQKFIPSAADTAIRSYRETIDLLNEEENSYNDRNPEAADQVYMDRALGDHVELSEFSQPVGKSAKVEDVQRPGIRKEVIALDEGDVVITFPADLSVESFGDLKDYLDLFIRKMQRRASRDDA